MKKLAIDEINNGPGDASDLLDADGSPICDSATAHKILSACIDRLSEADFGKVLEMLKAADLLTSDEERKIMAGGTEGDPEQAGAMDRRRRGAMDGRARVLPVST